MYGAIKKRNYPCSFSIHFTSYCFSCCSVYMHMGGGGNIFVVPFFVNGSPCLHFDRDAPNCGSWQTLMDCRCRHWRTREFLPPGSGCGLLTESPLRITDRRKFRIKIGLIRMQIYWHNWRIVTHQNDTHLHAGPHTFVTVKDQTLHL